MLQTDPQVLNRQPPQSTKAAVLVIGGAEDKVHGREILHEFFRRAGGTGGRIGILPCASREPSVIGSKYRYIFESMGASAVEVLDIRDREQSDDRQYLDYIETATGIFMTGGDQLRLCGMLADTTLMERIRQLVRQGAMALAGTSAGAAVMGHHMIAGGGSGESPNRSLVDMATGLAILPHVIVDQHFHNRNRMARLISAISLHPDRLGIGIDEDTCALFEEDGTIEVIGKGVVTIVDPAEVSYNSQTRIGAVDPISFHNLRVHLLSHGDRYCLHQRQPTAATANLDS
ncbi:MAG: cyanophycinase [Cyanobacteria bacterium]|nr:cyanophycinase [Cyanobacteriota bacterium]